MRLLDHFERIYIVNLPERADRRRDMDRELASLGLRADGNRVRYFAALRPDDAGDFPSRGARGCFLSHRAILSELVREQPASVLILEDDARLERALFDLPQHMREQLNGSWDMAYLGHGLELPDAACRWIDYQEPVATTHAYALSRRIYAPLLAHLEACLQRPSGHPLGSPMHVDGAYSLFRRQQPGYRTLVASPSLVGQRSSRSDIYPNRWFDRLPGSRQLVAALRNGRNRRGRSVGPVNSSVPVARA